MAFCLVKRTANNGKLKLMMNAIYVMKNKQLNTCCGSHYGKSLWKTVKDVCLFEISFGKVLDTEDCNVIPEYIYELYEDCNGYYHVLTLIPSYIATGCSYHLSVKLDEEILV